MTAADWLPAVYISKISIDDPAIYYSDLIYWNLVIILYDPENNKFVLTNCSIFNLLSV